MISISAPEGLPGWARVNDPAWWQEKMLGDLYFLCKVVLRHGKKREYHDLNWVHRELCDFLDMKKNPNPQKMVLMFRDGLKSSIARGYLIQWVLRCLKEKREAKAFYYSGVIDLAQDQLERVVRELTTNTLIQAFFDGVVPKRREDFEVAAVDKGKIRYRNVEIDIGSPDKPLTGRHYDLGINDNLVNEKNSNSPVVRGNIVKRWQQQESILVENAVELVFETTWARDDVAGIILNSDGKFDFERLRRRAAYVFTAETGYSVFSCTAATGPGLIGKPVFPEKVDEDYLRRKRAKQGPSTYSALYELQPVSESDIIFKTSWIHPIWNPETRPNPFIRNVTVDAAGTKGTQSSYTGIIDAEWSWDGFLFVNYAEKRKVTPMELEEWIWMIYNGALIEKRPVNMFWVEKEKYGIYLAESLPFRKKQLIGKIGLVTIGGVSRPDRLMSLQSPLENGKIITKPGMRELHDEIRTYYRDKNQGVDLLDALYLQFKQRQLPMKVSGDVVKEEEEDSFILQLRRDRKMNDLERRRIAAMF